MIGVGEDCSSSMELDLVEVGLLHLIHENDEFGYLVDLYYVFEDHEDHVMPNDEARSVWTFLEVFGGMELSVPEKEELRQSLRDVVIWATIKRAKSSPENRSLSDVKKRLSQYYDMTESRVQKARSDVDSMLEKLPDINVDKEATSSNISDLDNVSDFSVAS